MMTSSNDVIADTTVAVVKEESESTTVVVGDEETTSTKEGLESKMSNVTIATTESETSKASSPSPPPSEPEPEQEPSAGVVIPSEERMFDEEVEIKGVEHLMKVLSEDEKKYLRDVNEPLRHFRAEKGNTKKAIKKLQNAIQWRKEFEVYKLTQAFYEEKEEDSSPSSTDSEELAKSREMLKFESRTGKMYTRSYDKSGRAILYLKPTRECSTNETHNIRNLVYHLERTITCTEKNGYEKIVMIIDFDGWTMKNAVKLSLAKATLHILQECYPERLHRVYLCNPPFMFRAFWNMIKPFVDTVTKTKMVFTTSKSGMKCLKDDIDENVLEKCAFGTQELREFDMDEYFTSPMNTTFDEKM
jgi:transposase-like protein